MLKCLAVCTLALALTVALAGTHLSSNLLSLTTSCSRVAVLQRLVALMRFMTRTRYSTFVVLIGAEDFYTFGINSPQTIFVLLT